MNNGAMTPEQFEKLWRTEITSGFRCHCFRMTRNSDDAEDLIQESKIKAWRYRESFRENARFETWVYKIAENAWRDTLRARSQRVDTFSLDAHPPGDDRSYGEIIPAPGRSVEDTLAADAIVPELIQLAGNHDTRQVVRMMLDGHRRIDISEALGIDVGTVRTRMFRARRKIAKHLGLSNA